MAGAPDPADAALRYGQANALLGAIWQPVTRVFHVKDGWVRVEVDFERTEPALYGRVSLSLTVGELAALGLSFGVKALSVLLAVRREDRQPLCEPGRRSHRKAGRSTAGKKKTSPWAVAHSMKQHEAKREERRHEQWKSSILLPT